MNLGLGNYLSGWILVKARLGRHCQYAFPRLSIRRRSNPGSPEKIPLPVNRKGQILELIELPDDVIELACQLPENEPACEPGVLLRRAGWLERFLRMAFRILWTCTDLSRRERREAGLSLPNAVLDPHRAYRLASKLNPNLRADPYPGWSLRVNVLRDRDHRKILAHIARLSTHPRFQLVVSADSNGSDAIQTTLASLRRQLYRDFSCTVLDNDSALNASFDAGTELKAAGQEPRVVRRGVVGDWLTAFNASLANEWARDWVMMLHAGDVLPEHALYWFACEVLAKPNAAIIYSDDDELDADGRPCRPRFKPDWSFAHLRSTHYIGDAAVVRGGAVAAAGGVTRDCCRHGNYDLLLRVVDAVEEKVAHIPAVLYHRQVQDTPRSVTRGPWENPQWCVQQLKEHFERKGIEADVSETLAGCRRVKYRLPEEAPLISIIVPTRDALPLLRKCVESVLEKTTYPAFELVVVNNLSTDTDAVAYLNELATRSTVRVIRYDLPFNYAAISNFASEQAKGEILCLLNNDTEVLSADWLEEMASQLLQPQIGAVGARLLYADGRVQHGGVVVGTSACADHLHADLPGGHPGYCQRAVIAQELSAVTAACMLTWKHLYQELGGLNEKALPIAFNDVDYCLRLQDAGYRVIYTPHAELYHRESASRGTDTTWRERRRYRREVKYMWARWRERMKHDPYYNPNLSYDQPNFTLNWKPRIAKPWER